jgi:hypothetical protein
MYTPGNKYCPEQHMLLEALMPRKHPLDTQTLHQKQTHETTDHGLSADKFKPPNRWILATFNGC